ncbi:hypothetical protein MALG_01831 [Marinovum algicola DG 898]|nr:hypothetical protein MALG_01831 [Marinovum algicola DG 898]
MQVLFEREKLRLHTTQGDPLHEEAFEIWQEAGDLAARALAEMPRDDAEDLCHLLAATATRALTAGRDPGVITNVNGAVRTLHKAVEQRRAQAVGHALRIASIVFLLGLALGAVWIWIKPLAPWNALPRGFDLAANSVLLTIGWSGFTMAGFAFGWLFFRVAVLRVSEGQDLTRQARILDHVRAQILYIAMLSILLNFFLMYFEGFQRINQTLSVQLTSAPWALLLGVVAGLVEPTLFDRLRAALKFF